MSTLERAAVRDAVAFRGIPLAWLLVAASAWLGGGLYWDGWAHGYGLPDSFWTVWHAAFYAGYAACAVVLLAPVAVGRREAGGWRAAIPAGYGHAVAGVLVFAGGGIFDMLWHTLFGIELSTDALLSPSHLLLGTGAALIVSGPFVAARPSAGAGLLAQLPAVLSLTFLFGVFTFFSLFAGPYSTLIGAGPRPSDASLVRALLGTYLFSALVVGLALVAIRRRTLPVGALTVLLGLNGVAMILMRGHMAPSLQLTFMLVAVAAGAIGDLLLWRLGPSPDRVVATRVFAFAVPAIYLGLYLAAVLLRVGSGWTVHELTGMVALNGVIGLLVSFVFTDARARP